MARPSGAPTGTWAKLSCTRIPDDEDADDGDDGDVDEEEVDDAPYACRGAGTRVAGSAHFNGPWSGAARVAAVRTSLGVMAARAAMGDTETCCCCC